MTDFFTHIYGLLLECDGNDTYYFIFGYSLFLVVSDCFYTGCSQILFFFFWVFAVELSSDAGIRKTSE